MAVKTETKTDKTDYVEIGPLFYDGEKYKNPVPVIINGVKYSVPRGQKVKVPAVVAEVLQQSAQQDAYAAAIDKKMQEMQVTEM